MTPGQVLAALMKKHNIGQIELAEAADIGQASVNRMKNDKQLLNFKILKHLRIKYGVDTNEFFDAK